MEPLVHIIEYPPIIGLAETWLGSYNENLYKIPWIIHYFQSEKHRAGVGIAIRIYKN